MAGFVRAEAVAGIPELKKNPMRTVAAGEGAPVAILDRTEAPFSCVPAKAHEALLDRLKDLGLNAGSDACRGQPVIMVMPDDR